MVPQITRKSRLENKNKRITLPWIFMIVEKILRADQLSYLYLRRTRCWYVKMSVNYKLVHTTYWQEQPRAIGWRNKVDPQILRYFILPYFLVQDLLLNNNLFFSDRLIFFSVTYLDKVHTSEWISQVIQPQSASTLNVGLWDGGD